MSTRAGVLGGVLMAFLSGSGGAALADTGPDASLYIYSATDPGPILLELLISPLAFLDFSTMSPVRRFSDGHISRSFKRANGDTVLAMAGRRCLRLDFAATRRPAEAPALGPVDRTKQFEAFLRNYIAGLPNPRPAVVRADSTNVCARDF